MIRTWLNSMYAHNMTKASVMLPTSFRYLGTTRSDKAGWSEISGRNTAAKASPARTWPIMSIAPKIVEYQSGSSVIAQSIRAKLMTTP